MTKKGITANPLAGRGESRERNSPHCRRPRDGRGNVASSAHEESRHRLTLEALADVDSGRLLNQSEIDDCVKRLVKRQRPRHP